MHQQYEYIVRRNREEWNGETFKPYRTMFAYGENNTEVSENAQQGVLHLFQSESDIVEVGVRPVSQIVKHMYVFFGRELYV